MQSYLVVCDQRRDRQTSQSHRNLLKTGFFANISFEVHNCSGSHRQLIGQTCTLPSQICCFAQMFHTGLTVGTYFIIATQPLQNYVIYYIYMILMLKDLLILVQLYLEVIFQTVEAHSYICSKNKLQRVMD